MSFWNRFIDVGRAGTSYWRDRPLKRAFLDAKYALGERMVSAGIDDGGLVGRIKALDEKILHAQRTKVFSSALVAERKLLVLQLADAALEEEAPLPGVENEYQQTKNAQAELAGR